MYLKVPGKRLTLIVLANTEGLWWDNSLARAEIDTSPVAAAFLDGFVEEAPRPPRLHGTPPAGPRRPARSPPARPPPGRRRTRAAR